MTATSPEHFRWLAIPATLMLFLAAATQNVYAHCDALDGPVAVEARQALEEGDVTPVLKWVTEADEHEVREAFDETLAVRELGSRAQQLADRYFLETLVRLHRASEGAPYTGLKPAGEPVDEAVRATDQALEAADASRLVDPITQTVRDGLQHRYEKAADAKAKADESVKAGREYVHAYVELVHYAKAIRQIAAGHAHGPMHDGMPGPMHEDMPGPMHDRMNGPLHDEMPGQMHEDMHDRMNGPMHENMPGPMHEDMHPTGDREENESAAHEHDH